MSNLFHSNVLNNHEQTTNNYILHLTARGGAIGGAAVVGGTVAVLGATGGLSAIAAGTAVVAPIVWPLIGVGMLIGANANENKTKQEEQELRAIVWNRCLTERGYVVLSQR